MRVGCVIKNGLGRADLQVDVQRLRQCLLLHGYEELAITVAHAVAVRELPALHKDPFDRILLAQAQCERVTLLTGNAVSRPTGGGVVSYAVEGAASRVADVVTVAHSDERLQLATRGYSDPLRIVPDRDRLSARGPITRLV
jgi:hypothetical protein